MMMMYVTTVSRKLLVYFLSCVNVFFCSDVLLQAPSQSLSLILMFMWNTAWSTIVIIVGHLCFGNLWVWLDASTAYEHPY